MTIMKTDSLKESLMRFGIVFFLGYLMELLLVEIYYEAVCAAPETEISSPSRSEVGFRTYAQFTGKKVGECVEEALPCDGCPQHMRPG